MVSHLGFLSDPSPIIVYPYQQLTDSLTHSCLVNLMVEVEVFIVADVDDEDRVDNSLLQIWKRRFGHKIKLLFRL